MLDANLLARLREAGLPIEQRSDGWYAGEAADAGPHDSAEAALVAGVARLHTLYDQADDERNDYWVVIEQLTEEIYALHRGDNTPPQPFRTLINQLDPPIITEARVIKHTTRSAYILLVGDSWFGEYDSLGAARQDAKAHGFTVLL